MTQAILYFNGINGLTGSYGLEPMTDGELSAHILQPVHGESGGTHRLEMRLGGDNAKAIAWIVEFLAESNFEDVARDAAWRSAWIQTLAKGVAELLLGEEYTETDRLRQLEKRLQLHTVEKIRTIVELLAKGEAKELAPLLLEDQDESPENQRTLRVRLKRDTRSGLDAVQSQLRDGSQDVALESDSASQRRWIAALMRSLAAVPIDAANAIQRKKTKTLEPLQESLEQLAGSLVTPEASIEALCLELQAERTDIRWSKLLEIVHRNLETLLAGADRAVSWPELLSTLEAWVSALRSQVAMRRVIEAVDPKDLGQTGWGIIFPYEDPHATPRVPALKYALQPLLDLRQSQSGQFFKVYEGANGYRPNDTAAKFAARHGARVSDPADPNKLPYYLLLVGSPKEIPFHFQYQLDVQYAVGRIDFGDDMSAYENYARGVVSAETGGTQPSSRIVLFGVSNPDDRPTLASAEHLVQPLSEALHRDFGSEWQVDAHLGEAATRVELMRLLGGERAPALLFAACHGMEYPQDDPWGRQVRYQGALLCQDWPGPEAARGEICRDHYLAGEDLSAATNLEGLIAFLFACYSAGTPRFDEYTRAAFRERRETITAEPFVAALPKAMLSLRQGSALAVVGHVERAWGTSFLGPRQAQQIAVFQSALERLLKGHPVGSAMEYFNGRYAALSTELISVLEHSQWQRPEPYELAELWTANNDARGYVVIGDPAVRLSSVKTQ